MVEKRIPPSSPLSSLPSPLRLVSPANHFLFTPLLPGTAVGTLEFRAIQEPVRSIEGLEEYYQAKAEHLDLPNRKVTCVDLFSKKAFQLGFDHLVVAAGCKSNTFGTPGIESGERKHGRDGGDIFFLKHLYHARHIRNRLVECFERASNPTLTEAEKDAFTTFIVVGAGPTSCEFTTELADFLRSREMRKWYPELAARAKIVLVDPGEHIMSVFDATLAEYYEAHLKKIGVDLRLGNSVTAVVRSGARKEEGGGDEEEGDHGATPSVAQFRDGTEVPFGCLVWSAGNKPVRFIENAAADVSSSEGGLRRSHGGRLAVDDFLRVPGTGGRVFAAGDCAVHEEAPLPMTANVAEQQGAYLAKCFNDHYHPHMLSIMAEDEAPSSSSSGADTSSEMVLPPPGPVHPAAMPFFFLEPLDRLFTARSEFRYVERGAMASMGLGRVSKRIVSSLNFLPGCLIDRRIHLIE